MTISIEEIHGQIMHESGLNAMSLLSRRAENKKRNFAL